MASLSLDLLDLVLQRLNQHPVGALDSIDIDTFGSEALKVLLERQILVQQAMLDELDGCPVQWIGTKPFLFDVDADRPPEEVDPRLLIYSRSMCWHFVAVPTSESARWSSRSGACGGRILHRPSRKRKAAPVALPCSCAPRRQGGRDDPSAAWSHRYGQLVMLLPNIVELRRPTLRNLAAEKATVVPIPQALATNKSAKPFALDIPVQIDTEADAFAPARFKLDTGNQIAALNGKEADLTPREFDVLVALANEAKGARAGPPRRATDDHRGASPGSRRGVTPRPREHHQPHSPSADRSCRAPGSSGQANCPVQAKRGLSTTACRAHLGAKRRCHLLIAAPALIGDQASIWIGSG